MENINEMSKRSKIVLIIDENLLSIKSALKDLGFKVASFPQGTRDEDMFTLLSGKAIVTQNSKDFKIDAIIHDFDIVSCEQIKFIDKDVTRKNITAQKIANAIRESNLTSIHYNSILTITDDGTWSISRNI